MCRRRLAGELDEARQEGESLKQELAALSGRHEAKCAECEGLRDARAALERDSTEAINALEVRELRGRRSTLLM